MFPKGFMWNQTKLTLVELLNWMQFNVSHHVWLQSPDSFVVSSTCCVSLSLPLSQAQTHTHTGCLSHCVITLFPFVPFSESRPTVWHRKRLETTQPQLLQAEGGDQEDLDGSSTRLRAGRSRPGVHYFRSRWAFCHRNFGFIPLGPLDWAFNTGERNIEQQQEAHFTVAIGFLNILYIDVKISFVFFQKCNKLSCAVEAGNKDFTWSDALEVNYTNWADNEPAV